MKVCIARIIGNDLPPRHKIGQCVENVKFILENENKFENSERLWIINRIIYPEVLMKLLEILYSSDESVITIDFDSKFYKSLNSRERLLYVTNINSARNLAVDEGLKDCEICIPMDGGCFFTDSLFQSFYKFAYNHPYHGYFAILMSRMSSLSDTQFNPIEKWQVGKKIYLEHTEPQLAFSRNYDLRFNESLTYGNGDKTELLHNLGIKGIWRLWYKEAKNKSKFYGTVNFVPGVFRLPTNIESDTSNKSRAKKRSEGLNNLLIAANEVSSE